MDLAKLINQENATLVDVRNTDEFEEGSVTGAVNIPLHTIPVRVDEFKSMKQPIVVFCRSGNRSQQAAAFLKQQGVESLNGGGVEEVMAIKNFS